MIAFSYQQYSSANYFRGLNGLRCFSILYVIWHHSSDQTVFGWGLLNNGFLGVDLFFVISGFLIVTLLLRERERKGSISLSNFYIRRTLRIFPVYYTILLVTALFLLVFKSHRLISQVYFSDLTYYLTYTTNWILGTGFFAITWSLATEEQFYLAWPPMEKLAPKMCLWLLTLFIVFNQIINFRLFGTPDSVFWKGSGELFIMQSTFTPICFGVLLAHAMNTKTLFVQLSRIFQWQWTLWLLLVLLMVLMSYPGDLQGWPRVSIQLAMTLFLGAAVMNPRHPIVNILELPVLNRIGVVSYGMYLYHLFAKYISHLLLGMMGVNFVIFQFLSNVLMTYLIAEMSYTYYESAFLRLKDRYSPLKNFSQKSGKPLY